MNDVLERDRNASAHDRSAPGTLATDTVTLDAGDGGNLFPNRGVTVPQSAGGTPKRGVALALTWWTACTLWAYLVFGELVVVLGYPELLAVLGVILGFVTAGRRVRSLLHGTKLLMGAGATLLLSAVSIVLVPALLVPIVGRRYVALGGLLTVLLVALLVLSVIRTREQAARLGAPKASPRLPAIVAWLVVLAFTAVAGALATQG